LSGALLAGAFGVGDRAEARAGGDGGAGSFGDAALRLLDRGEVLAGLRVQAVVGGGGDRFELG
jgi:hypothetical protein